MSSHGPPATPRVRSSANACSACGCGQAVVEVVVLADDVHFGRPREVVLFGAVLHDHEVGRDGHGRVLPEDVAFGAVVVEQGVGGEAREVHLLGGVGHRRRDPRWQHLVERRVVLAPERGAPCVVQLVDIAVAVGEPAPERRGRHVAPAARVVATQLVGHVPETHRRMPAVAARHLLDERERVLPEDRRAGAPRLPAARPERVSGMVDRKDLRVGGREPRRGRGGRRGHVDRDAAVGQQSTTSSNQPKSNSPGRGSKSAHENTPSVTNPTPAACMRRTSSRHTARGHCSGL